MQYIILHILKSRFKKIEQAFWFRLRYFFFSVVIDSAREKEGLGESKKDRVRTCDKKCLLTLMMIAQNVKRNLLTERSRSKIDGFHAVDISLTNTGVCVCLLG